MSFYTRFLSDEMPTPPPPAGYPFGVLARDLNLRARMLPETTEAEAWELFANGEITGDEYRAVVEECVRTRTLRPKKPASDLFGVEWTRCIVHELSHPSDEACGLCADRILRHGLE